MCLLYSPFIGSLGFQSSTAQTALLHVPAGTVRADLHIFSVLRFSWLGVWELGVLVFAAFGVNLSQARRLQAPFSGEHTWRLN